MVCNFLNSVIIIFPTGKGNQEFFKSGATCPLLLFTPVVSNHIISTSRSFSILCQYSMPDPLELNL
jgi:hypothetical protein